MTLSAVAQFFATDWYQQTFYDVILNSVYPVNSTR